MSQPTKFCNHFCPPSCHGDSLTAVETGLKTTLSEPETQPGKVRKENPKSSLSDKRSLSLKVIQLGGCGEFGLHCTCFETEEDLVVVDCGLMFPEHDMPGVDVIFPDLTYLALKRDKIRGYLLTHGHDDHMGAVPYALETAPAPVYGTVFTPGMLRHR